MTTLTDTSFVSLPDFFTLLSNPLVLISILLSLGVVFVNGWTDSPNSVATAISTRAIPARQAVILSAIFNLIGCVVFSLFTVNVANSVFNIVTFKDLSSVSAAHSALFAMIGALIAVIAWGVLCWAFGIPSSQSHSLVAGLTGGCLALMVKGISAVPGGASWMDVGIGFFASGGMGLLLGFLVTKLIQVICKNMARYKTTIFFKRAQIVAACGMSVAHGAQDGIKFVGLIYMVLYLGAKAMPNSTLSLTASISPFYLTPNFLYLPVLVGLVIALGTSIGGYRIIKKVGMGMVALEPYEGFVTDVAAFIALLVSTLFGWPVSTGQVKTFSIIGVGVTKGVHKVNWRSARDVVLGCVFTFPGCILVGFVITLILLWIPV